MFKELIRKLDEYFSRDDKEIIRKLESKLTLAESELEDADVLLDDYEDLINEKEKQVEILTKELNTLKTQINPVELVRTSQKYRMRPDWYDYLHKSLNNFSKDAKYLNLYTEALLSLELKNSYSNADNLVYEIVYKFHKYIYNHSRYASDSKTFGTSEYWLTPQEVYEHFIVKGLKGDCFTGDTKIIIYDKIDRCYKNLEIKEINISRHLAVSYNEKEKKVVFNPILSVMNKGTRKIKKYKFNRGGEVKCTPDHRFAKFKNKGGNNPSIDYCKIEELENTKDNVFPSLSALPELKINVGKHQYSDAVRRPIHRLDKLLGANEVLPGLFGKSIKSAVDYGEEEVYDITVANDHNFFLSDSGILVHNCEDVSSALWGFIVSGLIYFGFENELYRLKRLDMIQPIGHAILIWLNDKGQWKRIESTYYPETFIEKWKDDSDIFKSAMTKVWHVFDEDTEYKMK